MSQPRICDDCGLLAEMPTIRMRHHKYKMIDKEALVETYLCVFCADRDADTRCNFEFYKPTVVAGTREQNAITCVLVMAFFLGWILMCLYLHS